MEELMIVANVAIVFGVIYKLFELFAGRRERMMLIEKMGDKLTPDRMLAAWIGGRAFGRIHVGMYHPTGLFV